GDLENAVAFQAYRQTLDLYLRLFAHQPDIIAIDQHPEYLSTKLGKQLAQTSEADISLVSIQHHHAHIAACMAENGIDLNTQPVLGIALDGLGYGEDGTLWGGEFLLADYRSIQRLACFKPIAMLGGEQAIYQPWRNTYAHLLAAFNWEALQTHYGQLELIQFLAQQPRSLLDQLLQKGIHSPLASSAGRLFDAVAAAVGVCRTQASYEGQGAIELEALMDATHLSQVEQDDSAYRFNLVSGFPSILDPSLMWRTLLNDLRDDVPIPLIAARFHVGLAAAIVHLVLQLRDHYLFTQVALTGGVFQNQILTQQVTQKLHRQGLIVLTHSKVPPNDGGISLGQATIAAARSIS
ncbi:MAG TPA: carbamoyltransferase HypF, partial [Allocoleopsis sp.]